MLTLKWHGTASVELECGGGKLLFDPFVPLNGSDVDVKLEDFDGFPDIFPPAVRVIEELKPKRILLDHYDDTFPPLTSPLDLLPVLERYGGRIQPLRYETIEL